MHYLFKLYLNNRAATSRNFQVPEIDVFLNQAQDSIIKDSVLYLNNKQGFETSNQGFNTVRTLIVSDMQIAITNSYAYLPLDFMYKLNVYCDIVKGKCNKTARVYVQQHDDLFEEEPLTRSSFEWNEINAVVDEKGYKLYTDNTFTLSKLRLTYIRKPKYIHNAIDYNGGSYKSLNGALLTGSFDSELPSTVHQDIVNRAVTLASASIDQPNRKMDLLNSNK